MFLCFNHESLAFFQDPKSEKTCSNFAFDPSRSTAASETLSLTCAKLICNGSFFFGQSPFFRLLIIGESTTGDFSGLGWRGLNLSLLTRLAVSTVY